MGRALAAVACLFLAAAGAFGQTATGDAAPVATDPWSFSATAFAYFVPDDEDYLLPVVTADRENLHFEARHNYEAPDTLSVWLGYSIGGGTELTWELTPILGVVYGETDGVALGYEGSVSWQSLELYSEGEYVFDSRGVENDFFYGWTELTAAPTDWLRLGLVGQRTRAYEAERDIQRGLLAAVTLSAVDITAYVLNPDDDPTVILSLSVDF